MLDDDDDGTFHEVQQFTGPVRWLAIVPAALLGWGVLQQVVLGIPWGTRPASNVVLVLLWLVLGLGLAVAIVASRLETRVDHRGLAVRFVPFRPRWEHYAFDRILSVGAVTYRPLLDYGGWGIRYGRRGWAYSVSGNRGVQLQFDDGRRLLIGSRRAEELAHALRR